MVYNVYMCNWIMVKDFKKVHLERKPLLILTGPDNIQRYVVGTWETGKGWKDSNGNSIWNPIAFKIIDQED